MNIKKCMNRSGCCFTSVRAGATNRRASFRSFQGTRYTLRNVYNRKIRGAPKEGTDALPSERGAFSAKRNSMHSSTQKIQHRTSFCMHVSYLIDFGSLLLSIVSPQEEDHPRQVVVDMSDNSVCKLLPAFVLVRVCTACFHRQHCVK